MFPVLFTIGSFEVTTFGLMMLFAFLAGAKAMAMQFERRSIPADTAWDLLPWVAIGGVLGAKLYYLALHGSEVAADPIRSLLSRGGLVWYGGFIGGVATFYWQVRKRKLSLRDAFDSAGPCLAIAYAFGRLGCFLVGDDYGMPTPTPVGVVFGPEAAVPSTAGYLRSVGAAIDPGISDASFVAVHPTQLYEIVAALLIFAILWRVSRMRLAPGLLFALYLALYGTQRFLIEFVRAKDDQFLLGLTTSQGMSLVLIASAVWLVISSRRPRGDRTVAV